MSEKKFKYLVADTTAFINNIQLINYADNILTVPDVVNEVKSKRQIRRLVVLPFDLQVREPDTESLAYVTKFAKKTGDFPSLSAIDLKVIALTYQLEKENVGTGHLREEPVVSKVFASKNKPEVFQDKTPLAGFYNPKIGKNRNDSVTKSNESENPDYDTEPDAEQDNLTSSEHETKTVEENVATNEEKVDNVHSDNNTSDLDDSQNPDDDAEGEFTEEHLRECFEKLKCDSTLIENDGILVPENQNEDSGTEENGSDDEEEDDEEEEEDEDDDSSWITPTNIKQLKKEFAGDVEELKDVTVACMTTDFAIQNVLKQMNLNIAALDGRVIKHLKTYILRCYACFKTTSIMTKTFCPNCGNKTLKRVAVSLDENGQQAIHINTRRPLTSKYKNQSLPRFQGGKHSRNPVLFEDQPIPKQMPSRVAKTKTCALNEDYTAGVSPFVQRDVDSKSALLRAKGNIKQWARNNEYEEFRRKKHFRLVK